jgi:hypothetical protein
MAVASRRLGPCGGLAGLGLLAVLSGAIAWREPAARADLIVLRGGGQIQGKMVPDPKNKDRVLVWLLQGRNPLSFQKGQIVEVIRRQSPLDDYLVKREKVAETAAAQFELGTWCEEHKLADFARLHYESALVLDSSFEPAHKKLGHVPRGGSWYSRDAISEAQGLVKYKGRWVSPTEKTKREGEAQTSAAQNTWLRRLRQLRQALISGPDDRRREAESQLMSIRDPDAVVPLLRVFGQDDRPRRILVALVLSAMGGPESAAGLVRRILDESDAEVRSITFDHLKQRNDAGATAQLVRALGSSDVRVINRAAWALGNLKAVETVPRLVTVLVTSEQRIVLEPPPGASAGVPALATVPGPALRGMNNSGIVVQSPPAVGTGVAAFGLSAMPFYQMGSGVGGGVPLGATIPQMPEPKVATFTYRNVEVLSALQKLTGEDFGYDVDLWREWIARSFNPNPKPVRRVPQP